MRRTGLRRAFLMTDLVVALTMAILLLMAVTASVSMLARGQRRMADSRYAARQLERALWTLQSGARPDASVSIERLPEAAQPGLAWVRVSLDSADGTSPRPSLTGVVPQAVLSGGAP